ncbi:hypothetical protein M8C13_02095 [Crossiella sp. SN42]|uniref:hypothetical protein n=1 Tax=Crossiella sp. SN42 TaxID=2944808 RepID=UPI00207C9ABE|nr:hypothetical protein [Crossiella sp. SN42]MCO1574547.1 hypothetical protein [Crossiella sp. SN42]
MLPQNNNRPPAGSVTTIDSHPGATGHAALPGIRILPHPGVKDMITVLGDHVLDHSGGSSRWDVQPLTVILEFPLL